MEQVAIGKFFVWTKHGHRPRKSHLNHKAALREAHRLAGKFPGHRFIVQEFHEKVFVDVEPSLTTDGKIATKMENDMKKAWVGIVHSGIQFFNSNPVGTVEGLQGSREFTYSENAQLKDPNGNNLFTSPETVGTDNAGTIQQSADNIGPQGGAAQA